MRFGCCGCMVVGRRPDHEEKIVTGVEVLDQMEGMGFDYIELSLSDIMRLSAKEFSRLSNHLDRSALRCEVCHNFFPSSIRLTGEQATPELALEYAKRAFDRMSVLGAKLVVLGSSGAKNVPAGFSISKAWSQLTDLLRGIDRLAVEHDITVALEPLNKKESNIINTLQEALTLSREVNRKSIKVLSDFYHMTIEDENPEVILEAGNDIRHVHFAEPAGRSFPRNVEKNYRSFFDKLKEIGYTARISIEAYTKDFEGEAPRALKVLQTLTQEP